MVRFVTWINLDLGGSITGLPLATATANSLISILLIVLFTATYSTTGGLRAVINTDVVQFALALIGTCIYAWFAVDAAGGLAGLAGRIAALYGPETAARMLSFGPQTAPDLLMPFLIINCHRSCAGVVARPAGERARARSLTAAGRWQGRRMRTAPA